MGGSMATIFMTFTGMSIGRTFLITAIMFGGVSLWGYTTKRDLARFSTFLFMGLIGVVIASLVNLFLGSTALQFAISIIGVLVRSEEQTSELQSLMRISSAVFC